MLRRVPHLFLFGSSKQTPAPKDNKDLAELREFGSFGNIVKQRRQRAALAEKISESYLPSNDQRLYYRQHLVEVTLYMRHDQWESQYIYSIMNYQKLGFRPVSDYVFLQHSKYALNMKDVPEAERFPLAKFDHPVREPVVIRGLEPIYEYLADNNLLRLEVPHDAVSKQVEDYINTNVCPNLQSLFWHPRLAFEYSFHTNLSSYQSRMINYSLVGIFYRNVSLVIRRSCSGLWKIYKNRDQYLNAKPNLTKGLKQLEIMMQGKDFMGGETPSHLDFYLFALLKTRMNGRLFENYLRYDVGGELWSWMIRMKRLTQYDNERVTLI